MTMRDCKHGSLARACLICELEQKVETLNLIIDDVERARSRLLAKNAELREHIQRWAKDITFNFDPRAHHVPSSHHPDYCGCCEFSWPCPWEVARELESD